MITNILKVLLEHDFLSANFYQQFLGQINLFGSITYVEINVGGGGGGTKS